MNDSVTAGHPVAIVVSSPNLVFAEALLRPMLVEIMNIRLFNAHRHGIKPFPDPPMVHLPLLCLIKYLLDSRLPKPVNSSVELQRASVLMIISSRACTSQEKRRKPKNNNMKIT